MKVAATYENGEIFQHFGRTPAFKVYEIQDGQVVSSEVIPTGGTGHGALAGFLREAGVDTLICGGIGGGAQAALEEAGIRLFAGAAGNPDEAVAALLAGTLPEIGEANCDHHHGEGHSCGHHEGGEGHCGHHEEEESCCGRHEEEQGCCGHHEEAQSCCGRPQRKQGRNTGKTCRVHYRGTFNDGTQFDSSYDRGEPLEFVCGSGMMIRGFDDAVTDMEVGQIVDIHLMPEEAYGPSDPNAIFTVELAELPGAENLEAGQQVVLTNSVGRPFRATVTEKTETTITFDANHEMAGKELNFRIELVEVQ